MYDRPADIPKLSDKIAASLGNTPHEYRNGLSSEQLAYIDRMDAATDAFKQAVDKDYRQAEGEAGMTYLAILKAYYDKWVK